MHWVFVSYSGKERERGSRVAELLKSFDFAVWEYQTDSQAKDYPAPRILEGLERACTVIVLLPETPGRFRRWMSWEIRRARDLGARLVFVQLHGVAYRYSPLLLRGDELIGDDDGRTIGALVGIVPSPDEIRRRRACFRLRTRATAALLVASWYLGLLAQLLYGWLHAPTTDASDAWSAALASRLLGVPAPYAIAFGCITTLLVMLATSGIAVQLAASERALYRGQQCSWVLATAAILAMSGVGAAYPFARGAQPAVAAGLFVGSLVSLALFILDGVPEARRLGLVAVPPAMLRLPPKLRRWLGSLCRALCW